MGTNVLALIPRTIAAHELPRLLERLAPALGAAAAFAAQEGVPAGPPRWRWGFRESEDAESREQHQRRLEAAMAAQGPVDDGLMVSGPGYLEIEMEWRRVVIGLAIRWSIFLEGPGYSDGPRAVCRAIARALGAREVLYGPDWLVEEETQDYETMRRRLLAEHGPPAPSLDIVRRLHDARQEAWHEAERSCPSPGGTWWDHPDAVAARDERDFRYERAWRAIRARFGRGEYFVERVE